VDRLCHAAAAVTLELALGADREQDRDRAREIVIGEMPARPEGQGDVAFCIELRRKHGLRLPFDFVRSAVRSAEKTPAPAMYVPPAPTARTPEEEERIALIAAARWTKPGKDELRRALLADHFVFVFAMIDARKLTVAEAARLFRCPRGLMTELRSDFRAGVFDWAVRPPVPASERAAWLAVVRREWPRRPDGQTPNEFCRALRKRFGFPLPFASVNHFLARERKKRPGDRSLYTAKQSRVRPALSAEDKKLLAALAKAKWFKMDDIDAFRRELLREYFPAVVAMMADWKLNAAQVGRLFRMGKQRAEQLHTEYREGTFDLAVAAPLSREEHAKWCAVVADEIEKSGGSIDNVAAFWRTMRKDLRLPLSLSAVRSVLKAVARRRQTGSVLGLAA
jgi:hypothetical protein